MVLWLFRLSLGRCVFLRTGFTHAHLKSTGNKPEHWYAKMMCVVVVINTSRHAFRNMVGSGSRSLG